MKRHLLKAMALAVGIVLAIGSYANSRSGFIENKSQFSDQYGQPRNDIDFKLDAGKGLTIFISNAGITYQWLEAQQDNTFTYCRMEAVLLNANPNATITTSGQQHYYERYFLPAINKSNNNTGVIAHSFNKITYHDIYPGIDWVLFLNKAGKLEHEFVVHPGADPGMIRVAYKGVSDLQLQADGGLKAVTAKGSIIEKAPYVYAENGKEIAASFALNKNVLSYQIAPYAGTLIIDPVLEWGTYFGGTLDETVAGIATDKWGYVYMAGNTNSTANIATTGSYQGTFAGGNTDAYISKWDSAGALLWATYYGGTNVDDARGIACDTAGNVLLFGATNSATGIATTGSYQESKAGIASRYDAFLIKFDSSGIRTWGTYLGGAQNDANATGTGAVAVDANNAIYITGTTQSTDFPVTANAFQSSHAGSHDVFIAKLSADGNLLWSTYFGGTAAEYVYGIVLGTSANVYIAGYTQSTDGIASAGAYQEINAGGQDAFLAKFDSSGSRIWSTYYGGTETDRALGISFSFNSNRIFLGGLTFSTDGMASAGSFQSNFSGGSGGDAFLSCFDLDGSRIWATYYGSDQPESLWQLWSNDIGAVYMIGETYSTANIATPGAVNENISGVMDGFLTKFDGDGQREWATYIGGSDIESYLKVTGFHSLVYVGGATNSANNISTDNSVLGGGNDAFLLKINDCEASAQPLNIEGNAEVCSSSENTYTVPVDAAALTYQWFLPDGWQGSSDSNSISVIAGANSGLIQVIAISACGGVSDTQSLAVTVLPSPVPVIVNNNNILATSEAYVTYQWILNDEDIPGAISPTYIPAQNGNYWVRVTNNDNCEGLSDAVTVSGVSGVAELSPKDDIQLFPNPAKDMLNIRATVDGSLSIYTMDGRCIIPETVFGSGTAQIDIRGLAQGVYNVRLTIKEQQKMWKLVKQ